MPKAGRLENIEKEIDLKKLYGLGKGLWAGEDARDYINRLREDRG